jgi:hypothetical protein
MDTLPDPSDAVSLSADRYERDWRRDIPTTKLDFISALPTLRPRVILQLSDFLSSAARSLYSPSL